LDRTVDMDKDMVQEVLKVKIAGKNNKDNAVRKNENVLRKIKKAPSQIAEKTMI